MNTCGSNLQRIFTLKETRPWRINPMFIKYLSLLFSSRHGIFQDIFILILNFFKFLFCDCAFINKLLTIEVHNWFKWTNLIVHKRLSKHRLINLIVTVATITNQVNNYIFMESVSPLSC